MKKPLIIIAGPTAVGKTATSIRLAKRIDGEIISADSMQVYKGMDIGTAKITEEEMADVPHYMLDELNPDEDFSVADFQKMSNNNYDKIYAKGKKPIFVGGTGFYLQSIIYDVDFNEMDKDEDYREELQHMANEKGAMALHQLLEQVDPESAEKIHYNNVKRVIRALEYYKQTGEPISLHNEREKKKSSPYNVAFFVLTMNRELLYKRIDERVDIMVNNGLLQEVESLLNKGYTWDLVSMKGLGYKEFRDYFEGKMSLDEAIYVLKRDTRHFAKRQFTWFKRDPHVKWIHVDDFDLDATKITDFMVNYMHEDLHIL